MKRILKLALALAMAMMVNPSQAQLIEGKRGSEDFKIGVAGYSYRKFNIEQTLTLLKSMEVKYLSVKDWWLPLNSTKEQMAAFKAKCAEYGVNPYILGPIYMKSEAEVDRAFAYAERYGSDVFIGVPNYELADYVIKKVKRQASRWLSTLTVPTGLLSPTFRRLPRFSKTHHLVLAVVWTSVIRFVWARIS
jgi:hypothetical protein